MKIFKPYLVSAKPRVVQPDLLPTRYIWTWFLMKASTEINKVIYSSPN